MLNDDITYVFHFGEVGFCDDDDNDDDHLIKMIEGDEAHTQNFMASAFLLCTVVTVNYGA